MYKDHEINWEDDFIFTFWYYYHIDLIHTEWTHCHWCMDGLFD